MTCVTGRPCLGEVQQGHIGSLYVIPQLVMYMMDILSPELSEVIKQSHLISQEEKKRTRVSAWTLYSTSLEVLRSRCKSLWGISRRESFS